MKITTVKYRVPSREVSNNDVLELIDASNPSVAKAKKRCYLAAVRQLFRMCSANTRFWRDVEGGERAGDLIIGAMDDAFADANMNANDVDLLIYCGVGKGFVEPANAYFYAKAQGMRHANCFDITDACMSWVRALQMVYLLQKSGAVRRAMIINGECHYGIHDNWTIRDLRSLQHTFPMYTIGEAASATILEPSDDIWRFDYESEPALADLCTIPMESHAEFVEPNERIGLNGVNRFVSFGRDLLTHGVRLTTGLMKQSIADFESKDWYFPHAPSKTVYETAFEDIGAPVSRLYLEVFPNFGNLVSASIPVGLSLASANGQLRRGDDVALVPASAGMVASVVQFAY